MKKDEIELEFEANDSSDDIIYKTKEYLSKKGIKSPNISKLHRLDVPDLRAVFFPRTKERLEFLKNKYNLK